MLISKTLFPTETANSVCLLQELEQETCPEGRNCLKTKGIKGWSICKNLIDGFLLKKYNFCITKWESTSQGKIRLKFSSYLVSYFPLKNINWRINSHRFMTFSYHSDALRWITKLSHILLVCFPQKLHETWLPEACRPNPVS